MAATNDRYQIRLYCTVGQQTSINVLNYLITGANGTVTDQQIATLMSTYVSDYYKSCLGNNANYYGLDLRKWSGTTLGVIYTSKAGSGSGAATGNLLPKQVAGIISLRVNAPGRHGRGRIFVAFPSTGSNEGAGVPTLGYNGSVAALAAALVGPFTVVQSTGNNVTLQLCVRNRADGSQQPVASVLVPFKWANQHRRGDYGRINPPPF